jgi:hypothetical protein
MTKALESPGLLENYSTIFTGNELKNNENMWGQSVLQLNRMAFEYSTEALPRR